MQASSFKTVSLFSFIILLLKNHSSSFLLFIILSFIVSRGYKNTVKKHFIIIYDMNKRIVKYGMSFFKI